MKIINHSQEEQAVNIGKLIHVHYPAKVASIHLGSRKTTNLRLSLHNQVLKDRQ